MMSFQLNMAHLAERAHLLPGRFPASPHRNGRSGAWLYLRNEGGARLITGDFEPLLERGQTALAANQQAPSSAEHQQGLVGNL
jgi:hypothetical protein